MQWTRQPDRGRDNPRRNDPRRNDKFQTSSVDFGKKVKEKFGEKRLKEWDADGILELGEELGKYLAEKKVTASQIRKFVDELQRIRHERHASDTDVLNQAKLTKIRLIYTIGSQKRERNNPHPLEQFERVYTHALTRMEGREDFNTLVRFVETVVAYHRYYGGRD